MIHLVESNEKQWKEINTMKTLLIASLVSGIFTLIGIVFNLALNLKKLG